VYCIPPTPNQSCPFITIRFDIIGREVKLVSITNEEERDQKGVTQQNPLYQFMYALKSSEARRQYSKRLKMLFDYLKLSGPLEEQAKEFLNKTRQNGIQWAQDRIMIFLDSHKQSQKERTCCRYP
jgi:hypothetical protein